MDLYVITIAISFVCSIAGLYLIKENRRSFLKWFTPFLLLTLIVEFEGTLMSARRVNNTALYNYFSTFEFAFYFVYFYYHLRSRALKNFALCLGIAYPLIALANILFYQGRAPYGFHTYTVMLGAILIVICCMLYFNEMLRFPGTSSLVHIPAFWINTGLLFFYSSTFATISLTNYLSKISYFSKIFSEILEKSNILLYLLISIGLLCTLKLRKSLS